MSYLRNKRNKSIKNYLKNKKNGIDYIEVNGKKCAYSKVNGKWSLSDYNMQQVGAKNEREDSKP